MKQRGKETGCRIICTPFRLSYHTKSGNLSDKGRWRCGGPNPKTRPCLDFHGIHDTNYTRLIWLLSNTTCLSSASIPNNCHNNHLPEPQLILPPYIRLSPVLIYIRSVDAVYSVPLIVTVVLLIVSHVPIVALQPESFWQY